MPTIVARVLPDGSLVEVLADGTTRPMADPTDWSAVDALTEEEIEAAARSDPDALPLSDEALSRARRGPHPRFVRLRLRLSREEFAKRYQIPLDVLISWETHQTHPDDVARSYLKAILADPNGVAKAFKSNWRAAE